MKRNWQKLAALALAFALALALALPAWADPAPLIGNTDRGTITLSNLEPGATATAYQVIAVNYDYEADVPEEPVYSWTSAVADWVRTNHSTYIGAGTDNSVQKAYQTAEHAKALADAMAAAIRGGTEITGLTAISYNSGFTNLDMGTYLILVEGGTKIYSPALVNLVPEWDETTSKWVLNPEAVDVALKSSDATVSKSVNKATVAIGDSVTFTLTADVPQFPASATATGFEISDSLPTGLSLNTGSIQVYGGDADSQSTALTANTHYTLMTENATRPDGTSVSFNIEFVYARVKSYQKIKVTYTATANENVVIHNGTDGGNTNHAYLDYNNNPYGDKDNWKTDEDTATVYSYGIKVTKQDGETQTVLPGAEFTLSESQEGTSPISFISEGNGVYRVAKTGEQDATTTLTVGGADADTMKGVLKLSGLDRGKYYLTETQAPAGYNKLGSPVEITIVDVDPNGKPMDGENESSDGYVHITVVNTKGFNLPETGGMGTVLFTAGGILLMGAGVAVLALFVRRRGAAK